MPYLLNLLAEYNLSVEPLPKLQVFTGSEQPGSWGLSYPYRPSISSEGLDWGPEASGGACP